MTLATIIALATMLAITGIAQDELLAQAQTTTAPTRQGSLFGPSTFNVYVTCPSGQTVHQQAKAAQAPVNINVNCNGGGTGGGTPIPGPPGKQGPPGNSSQIIIVTAQGNLTLPATTTAAKPPLVP